VGRDPHSGRVRGTKAAYETVIAACCKQGKWPGVYDEALMQRYIGIGMRLVLSGSDGAFLMAGASRRAALVRQWGGKI
jgi:4-hydroxy-2-oxoheptanedioate aldolase